MRKQESGLTTLTTARSRNLCCGVLFEEICRVQIAGNFEGAYFQVMTIKKRFAQFRKGSGRSTPSTNQAKNQLSKDSRYSVVKRKLHRRNTARKLRATERRKTSYEALLQIWEKRGIAMVCSADQTPSLSAQLLKQRASKAESVPPRNVRLCEGCGSRVTADLEASHRLAAKACGGRLPEEGLSKSLGIRLE